jgi:hypothetical protein
MSYLLGIAIFGSFPCAVILWTWAAVWTLRSFGISLPLSFAVHFYPRRQRELQIALYGVSKEMYVLIRGFLLFACPMFVGMSTYDLLAGRFIRHSAYSAGSFTGSLVIWTITGVWVGVSEWKTLNEKRIDSKI